jgi:hypothetical protein
MCGWWCSMRARSVAKRFRLFCVVACLLRASPAAASQYHGQLTSGGFPVPGATITVTQGTKKISTVSDQGGLFNFVDLEDGPAKIEIEMQGFSTIEADVTITPNMPAAKWELSLLPIDQMLARTKLVPTFPSNPQPNVEPTGSAKSLLMRRTATPTSGGRQPGTIGRISGQWQREQRGDFEVLAG